MATEKIGKVGGKYGINLTLKRELTPKEAEFINKVLDMTVSALRLNLRDDVALEKPNHAKCPNPR